MSSKDKDLKRNGTDTESETDASSAAPSITSAVQVTNVSSTPQPRRTQANNDNSSNQNDAITTPHQQRHQR